MEPEEREFFEHRFSEKELRQLVGKKSAKDVFSWKSPAFKKLGVEPEELDDERLITLMLEEPRLIRRPLVEVDGRLIDGRDTQALADALA